MKFLITVTTIFLIGIILLFAYFNFSALIKPQAQPLILIPIPSSSPATPNVNPEPIKSSQPITSSPTPQSKPYQNPCPSGQFELFEGGLSSGCEPR